MVSRSLINTCSTDELIPDVVKHVAGEFSSSILSIWGINYITEYMVATATQRHVWHAVLSVPNSKLPPNINMRTWLTSCRCKELLRISFGTYPPGMIGLLSKLGPCAESPDFYNSAHVALSRRDSLTRILQHSHTIEPRTISWIAAMPTEKLAVNLACYILREKIRYFEIDELIWISKRLIESSVKGERVANISKLTNPVTVLRKSIAKIPFPPVPWNIQGLLLIKSGDELLEVAGQLRNCLADDVYFYSSCLDAQAGQCCFFRTLDDDFLLLKFCKFGSLGWYIEECSGRQNRKPTQNEFDKIAHATSHLDHIWHRRLNFLLM